MQDNVQVKMRQANVHPVFSNKEIGTLLGISDSNVSRRIIEIIEKA